MNQDFDGGRCAVLLVLAVGSTLLAQPRWRIRIRDKQEVSMVRGDFSNGCLIKFIAFQKDMTIREGLRLLAALCKKNIVPSGAVEGPLTISRLYNVTFESARAVQRQHVRQDGDRAGMHKELKKIKGDPSRMVHKVITLYHHGGGRKLQRSERFDRRRSR
jgi:hypothetical protein